MLVLEVYLYSLLPYNWGWFLVLVLALDIDMIRYFFGNKTDTFFYNLFHCKTVAIVVYGIGVCFSLPICQLIGVILFLYSSFGPMFGYGLKYGKGFKFTHLGEIENG